MSIVLHGYWRSTASYRLRIALALKGLSYEQVTHDLRLDEQRSDLFRAINPQCLVPALIVDGQQFTQSQAIMELLEERFPEPRLLPSGSNDRAIVRSMAALICCDIHPLNNMRVLQSLRADFQAGEAQVKSWIARWIGDGFTALECQIARHGGHFAFGDEPTIADCCVVPQVYSAQRFGVDMAPFPMIEQRVKHCLQLPAFSGAHPARQPDADAP